MIIELTGPLRIGFKSTISPGKVFNEFGGNFCKIFTPSLLALAQYLNVEVKHAMRKQEIKNILIVRLVEDDLLDGFYLDHKVLIDHGSADNAVKLKQLDIQKEMEMANWNWKTHSNSKS